MPKYTRREALLQALPDADRCIYSDELEVVDSLDDTARGNNGFGSSGR